MSNPRHERWNTAAIVLGALCLLVISVTEATGLATPTMRNVLLLGLVVAGTVMWLVQSAKHCPHCGQRVGLGLRLLKPYQCRNCGGDIREEPK